jgi:putative spermidine/putrescine transport system ATP-binding protein
MNSAPQTAGLTFEGVAKRYGSVTALEPTDLAVLPGEFLALLGPSGSGKTTLLGIAAGFVPPSEGRVLVNGSDITQRPPERRNIGMVFQNYSLFPFMSVAANVAFPLEMRKQPKADIADRVRRMLAMVRLSHLADRFPGELSGGQQQRVALARAAVYNPSVLLMDEPLGALDKNLREEMQDEIKQFHQKIGATIIYVTHDQEEAACMADRIAILNHGRLVQQGTQAQLYAHPFNSFVAGFLGEANLLHVETCETGRNSRNWATTREGLRLVLPDDCGGKQPRVACIRPVDVTVSVQPPGNGTCCAGTIVEAMHIADSVRYRIELTAGCQILARAPVKRGSVPLRRGAAVHVHWDPGSVLFMPE